MVAGTDGYILWTATADDAKRMVAEGVATIEEIDMRSVINRVHVPWTGIHAQAKEVRPSTNSVRLHTHRQAEGYGLKRICHELKACGLVGVRV